MAIPGSECALSAFDRGELRPGYPPRVLCIEPTNACNLHCVTCPPRRRPTVFLEPQVLACWVDREPEVFSAAPVWLHHTGEPLLHPRFEALVEVLTSRGAVVGVSTNALLLSEERAARLLGCGLRTVVFSLDAAKADTYARLRPGGTLARAEAGARRVIASRHRSPATELQAQLVHYDQSPGEVLEFLRRWADAGVDSLHIKGFLGRGGTVPPPPGWNGGAPRAEGCLEPWSHAVIGADGLVVPCCADFQAELGLGSLQHQTLSEIWRSAEAAGLRRAHLGQAPLPDVCMRCSDKRTRSNPTTGLVTLERLPTDEVRCAELLAQHHRHVVIHPG